MPHTLEVHLDHPTVVYGPNSLVDGTLIYTVTGSNVSGVKSIELTLSGLAQLVYYTNQASNGRQHGGRHRHVVHRPVLSLGHPITTIPVVGGEVRVGRYEQRFRFHLVSGNGLLLPPSMEFEESWVRYEIQGHVRRGMLRSDDYSTPARIRFMQPLDMRVPRFSTPLSGSATAIAGMCCWASGSVEMTARTPTSALLLNQPFDVSISAVNHAKHGFVVQLRVYETVTCNFGNSNRSPSQDVWKGPERKFDAAQRQVTITERISIAMSNQTSLAMTDPFTVAHVLGVEVWSLALGCCRGESCAIPICIGLDCHAVVPPAGTPYLFYGSNLPPMPASVAQPAWHTLPPPSVTVSAPDGKAMDARVGLSLDRGSSGLGSGLGSGSLASSSAKPPSVYELYRYGEAPGAGSSSSSSGPPASAPPPPLENEVDLGGSTAPPPEYLAEYRS